MKQHNRVKKFNARLTAFEKSGGQGYHKPGKFSRAASGKPKRANRFEDKAQAEYAARTYTGLRKLAALDYLKRG